jgi:hypothetical protein
MEKLTFTMARLFYVRDIMAIMCVSMVESLCQTPMGQILALDYVLSGAHGFLWPRLITSDNKCHCFPSPRCRWSLSAIEIHRAGQLVAQAHLGLGREAE